MPTPHLPHPVLHPRWTPYTTDEVAWNWVMSINVAPDGALWLGTRAGVSRYLPPD